VPRNSTTPIELIAEAFGLDRAERALSAAGTG